MDVLMDLSGPLYHAVCWWYHCQWLEPCKAILKRSCEDNLGQQRRPLVANKSLTLYLICILDWIMRVAWNFWNWFPSIQWKEIESLVEFTARPASKFPFWYSIAHSTHDLHVPWVSPWGLLKDIWRKVIPYWDTCWEYGKGWRTFWCSYVVSDIRCYGSSIIEVSQEPTTGTSTF